MGPLWQFLLINLYLFGSIFLGGGIVGIDKLHNCVEGISLLNNKCYGSEKKTLFQLL